jgi:hypothetical protein
VGFGRDSPFLSSLIRALRGLSCPRSFTALIFKNPQNIPRVGKIWASVYCFSLFNNAAAGVTLNLMDKYIDKVESLPLQSSPSNPSISNPSLSLVKLILLHEPKKQRSVRT